jgi:hypothetical protein
VPFGARTIRALTTQILLARRALSADHHAERPLPVHGSRFRRARHRALGTEDAVFLARAKHLVASRAAVEVTGTRSRAWSPACGDSRSGRMTDSSRITTRTYDQTGRPLYAASSRLAQRHGIQHRSRSIFSVTKNVMSTLVGIAIDEGRFHLDDRLAMQGPPADDQSRHPKASNAQQTAPRRHGVGCGRQHRRRRHSYAKTQPGCTPGA